MPFAMNIKYTPNGSPHSNTPVKKYHNDIRSIKKYDATDRKFNFFISNTILWLHFQKIITFSE